MDLPTQTRRGNSNNEMVIGKENGCLEAGDTDVWKLILQDTRDHRANGQEDEYYIKSQNEYCQKCVAEPEGVT